MFLLNLLNQQNHLILKIQRLSLDQKTQLYLKSLMNLM
jgi:hypothetical protein